MKLLRSAWIWLAIILIATLSWFAFRYWQNKDAAPEYRTAQIERGAIAATVSASGTLSPVVSVQVGSQVSGQLRDVLVDFNTPVQRGQLIARIDPETFEYRVRQAQADVDAAQAQVMTQQANVAAQRAALAKAEVDLAEAKRDLDSKQQLVERGFISGAERDRALAAYSSAREQVNTVKAQNAVAAAGVRNAQAVVKQREAGLAQARIDLARTEIRAPVDGVVIKRSVERGQTVAASLQAPELFVIAENLADMQVDAAIDESEIGRLRVGQKATFTVDAFPARSFEGEVRQIRMAAQNVSNVVTYTVVIGAANPRLELLPGMTANVRVVLASRDGVLKVPNSALRFRPPGASPAERGMMPVANGEASNGTAGSVGQEHAGHAGQGGGAMRARLAQLGLTDAQNAQLDALFAAQRERQPRAGADAADNTETGADDGSARRSAGNRGDARAAMRAQIMAILTPEQRVKYEELQAVGAEGGSKPGRIYVLDENRQPRALDVRLGLSDTTATEVTGPQLTEGMQIITGAALAGQSAAGRPGRAPGPRMF